MFEEENIIRRGDYTFCIFEPKMGKIKDQKGKEHDHSQCRRYGYEGRN